MIARVRHVFGVELDWVPLDWVILIPMIGFYSTVLVNGVELFVREASCLAMQLTI